MIGASIKLKLRKWLSVPGPVELGMSDCDALGSRNLTPFQEGPTWEDWEERVRKEYPVRYFLYETVGGWFSRQATRLQRRWDWLMCHVVPKHRYHVLDLRGIDPIGHYDWGYLIPSEVMRLSAWKALRLYIERDKPEDPAIAYPGEYRTEPWYSQAKATYDEAQALYHYWMVERVETEKRDNEVYQAKRAAAEARDRERYEILTKEWLDLHREAEDRELEMFQRLAKLQPYLVP